jgi:dethiobiotin synthetase
MTAPLLVVSGTGTGIGKTAVAASLVRVAGLQASVAGLKPVETGGTSDADALGQASTFHVTRFTSPYLLDDPVSPNVAARRSSRTIDIPTIVEWLAPFRCQADAVLVELPGGLFSPLSDTTTNADLVAALGPAKLLLVAPDRLGVLHDVLATVHAAAGRGITVDALVLSAAEHPDASTGTNAAELERLLPSVRVQASVPRVRHLTDLDDDLRALLPLLHWP